ncbi:TlpA family protein disulfide reductase [Novipirellula artificiosorum]|uniref:TlpA family protein disulfide reductase n=1 Tax=Novipirellula artificiosorum TaxID=2528016 RepID=UPI0018CFCFF2|nr:TlpA disulfide reductase family protein [Novipirellula artificiosorum]
MSLFTLTLLTTLLAVGCDRQTDSDVASRELENVPPAAADLVGSTVSSAEEGAEATATVPNLPTRQSDTPPAKLGIGDPSPSLHLAKWIKGEPVESTLSGKVHVVEFWATWCGPCRAGMPHISALQSEFSDEVAFIGVTRENESTVTGFLEDSDQWQIARFGTCTEGCSKSV